MAWTALDIIKEYARLVVTEFRLFRAELGEKLGRITMSVGVAEYINGENMTDLIERADAALYTAKHNGRNQVAAAPTPMGKRSTGA